MRYMLRFMWNATRGHRLTPWRSPYLLWRIETYCGVKMQQIGFLEFWEFLWHERRNLWRFLKWTGEMEHYARPAPKKRRLVSGRDMGDGVEDGRSALSAGGWTNI